MNRDLIKAVVETTPFLQTCQQSWEQGGNKDLHPFVEWSLWQFFPQVMTRLMINDAESTIAKKARMELPAQEFFKPSELARIFAVSAQTIRNLDGKLDPPLKPHLTDGGHRRYTQNQAQQIRRYFAS